VLEVAEIGHALRASSQLADRLGASEHEDGEDGQTLGVQAETFVEYLAVSGGRGPFARVDETKEASLFERGKSILYGRLVIGDDGVAV
jgi:hypothetical protein